MLPTTKIQPLFHVHQTQNHKKSAIHQQEHFGRIVKNGVNKILLHMVEKLVRFGDII